MARPLRIEHPGGWYHLTARGNERRAIFRDDRDRAHFLELLENMVGRFGVCLHCFVLMDNHYHLIVQLRQANLSLALQWLNLSYSAWFNRRHDRVGHLFQGRFKSVLFDAAASALELSRYVHLNPVRVGRLGLGKGQRVAGRTGAASAPDPKQVRERLDRLRRYRWSSYRAYIGSGPRPAWLECGQIGRMQRGSEEEQRERYRQYVEGAIRDGLETTDVWAELKEGAILGSDRFVQGVRDRLTGDRQEQRAADRLKQERLDWRGLIATVEKVNGEPWERLRERHGDSARDMVLYLGQCRCGMKLKELAAESGLESYGAVAMAIKRYGNKLARDAGEAARMNSIIQMLNVKM
jgi:REP element-mobilizing transposase RayT